MEQVCYFLRTAGIMTVSLFGDEHTEATQKLLVLQELAFGEL